MIEPVQLAEGSRRELEILARAVRAAGIEAEVGPPPEGCKPSG